MEIFFALLAYRSMISKSIMATAPSCIDNSQRSTTLLAADSATIMMTSSNGDIFRVTGHLCGKFTGPGEFPAQLRGDLMVSLICAWIHGWVNNGEAGDLKRHRAHYDVIVVIHDGAVGKMDLDIMLLCPWLRSVKLRGAYYMHTANVISPYWISHLDINSSPPGINGRHSQMIFQMHILYEKFYVFIKISRTLIPLGPIE